MKKVRFEDPPLVEDEMKEEHRNTIPDPVKLLNECGTCVLLDLPVGSEFGIDLNTWTTDVNFKGVKLIPTSGVHFIHWRIVDVKQENRQHSHSSRGFFHLFGRGEVVVKKFDHESEDMVNVHLHESCEEYKLQNLINLDRNLAPYPITKDNEWKKWICLSNKISFRTLDRLVPTCGYLDSAASSTCLPSDDDIELEMPKTRQVVSQNELIRYVSIPTNKRNIPPSNSTVSQITAYGMNKTSLNSSQTFESFVDEFKKLYNTSDHVSNVMSDVNIFDEIEAELQFAFVAFLVGQNYDSFEHWKKLLHLICSSTTTELRLRSFTGFYINFLNDVYFQIAHVSPDLFVDIVTSDNFLFVALSKLFCRKREEQETDASKTDDDGESYSLLLKKLKSFKKYLEIKFTWNLNDEREDQLDQFDELNSEIGLSKTDFDTLDFDDEDAPIIVEINV